MHGADVPSSRSLPVAVGILVWSLLDGTEPTRFSPAYADSVAVATSLVLKARAFRAGSEPSATLTAEYTIGPESVPPSVRVSVLPPANAAGWHNAPVRLVYTCANAQSGLARCPAETVVDTEGARQTVTSVAVDQAGNEAVSAVTLSIDRTPPTLRMTAPRHGEVVTGTVVTVTGTVTDELSGVAGARCNGAPATVIRGTVACTVAVRPGVNPVVLQVSDRAGNAVIAGVRVIVAAPPSTVTIAPQRVTLAPGEHREFRLLDQTGAPVVGATWSLNETDVLSATQTDAGLEVSALAVGTAAVHADWNGLMAETVVTVMAPTSEGRLPSGTSRWTIPKLDPGATLATFFVANRVDASGPDLFVLETGATGAALRGVSSDGIPLRAWSLPVEAKMVLADRDNGVLLITGQSRGLLRVPGSEAGRPWWYLPEGAREIEAGVQSPDGTIFVLETADDGLGTNTLVGLDGLTGTVMFRIASLGRQHDRVLHGDGPGSVIDSGVRAAPMNPVVFGYDNAAYAGTYSEQRSVDRSTGLRTDHVEAHLMRVEPDGTASATMMESRDATRPASEPALTVKMGRIGPDPRGGAHVEWTFSNGTTPAAARHGRGGFGGAPTSVQGPLPFTRVGGALTGYDEAGNAYDMETGALRYSTPPGSTFVAALVGGGVAYRLGTDLIETDGAGAVVKISPYPGMSSDAAPIRKPPDR